MDIKNIVIIGGGVLGSQIAFQSAYCGFNVTILEADKKYFKKVRQKLNTLKKTYIDTVETMATDNGKSFNNWARGLASYDDFNKEECIKKIEEASQNINLDDDIREVVKDADLVIESITEKIDSKITLYKNLSSLLPDKTIVATNSSTIVPSKLAKYTKRADKFLAIHFANSIWKNNTAEIMCHSKTDKKYFDALIEFAKKINMIPIPLYKEKSGYLLNSMLIPFLFSGMDLYVNGISNPEDIDRAWTLGTGAPKGPFRILDIVGLETAYNIVHMYVKIPSFLAPYNFKGIEKMLKTYIDEGKLGTTSGEGFYKYSSSEIEE